VGRVLRADRQSYRAAVGENGRNGHTCAAWADVPGYECSYLLDELVCVCVCMVCVCAHLYFHAVLTCLVLKWCLPHRKGNGWKVVVEAHTPASAVLFYYYN